MILIVVMTIATILTACASRSDGAQLDNVQKAFYQSWMSNIKDDAPINRVAIIGSHDSGISTTKHIFKAMTKTQDLTIGKQLDYGCRYFDIRVSKNKKGDLTLFHSIDKTGEKFSYVLSDLLLFIKTNPSEFLVLDFQHFAGESQQAVIDTIAKSGLKEYAIHNTTTKSDIDFVSDLTVADMRGKVILFWGSDEAYNNTHLFRRNNDSCSINDAVLDSLYNSTDNKLASDKFIEQTIPKYFAHILQKPKGMTVLQAQLTSSKLLGSLKKLENGHNEAMSKYIRSIESDQTHLAAVNIIMRDFVGSDLEKSNSILHLNIAKDIIKSNCISNFDNLTKAV